MSTASASDVFFAAKSNTSALDRDAKGGNPFATSLIELLARPQIALAAVPGELARLTQLNSKGRQQADVPPSVTQPEWSLVPRPSSESRIALVMVVSDYSSSPSIASLRGAAFDAERTAIALGRAGFVTQKLLDLSLHEMREQLASFAEVSAGFDAAAIYTTGHGVEIGGEVFLLPGDIQSDGYGEPDYARRALKLRVILKSACARRVNLVFFGGCRLVQTPRR